MRALGDDLDRKLIAILQSNAREPTSSIARKLGVARSTVHERIARLEKNGVITGYAALLANPEDGEHVQALVMLAVEQKQSRAMIQKLETFPEIRACLAVSGEFDLYLVVEAPRLDDLDEVLDDIAAIPGIQRSRSSIVLARKFDRRHQLRR